MSDEKRVTDAKVQTKVDKLLNAVKNSKLLETREHNTKAFKQYVVTQAQEMTKEHFNDFMSEINKRILSLVQSLIVTEKLGGILIIDEFMDIDGEDNGTKIDRANYLRAALGGINDQDIMKSACKALGHVVLLGDSTHFNDFVDFEVKRALEWLEMDRKESRRHTAVLVLKELALNSPTQFYVSVLNFVDKITPVIKDPKYQIRIDAVSALEAFMIVCSQRGLQGRSQTNAKIYTVAMEGLRKPTKDHVIHGSLLMLGEMFQHTGTFMEPPRYQEACQTIFKFQNHRNEYIQHEVMKLMSVVAKFRDDVCRAVFVPDYLPLCVSHLQKMLHRDRERSAAFESIGKLAEVVGPAFKDYVKFVIADMRETFLARNRSKSGSPNQHHVAVFKCISSLAKSMRSAITADLSDLLDLMFRSGLTSELTDALKNIADNIPDLLIPIQDRLLEMLSTVLSAPYNEPGEQSGSLMTGGALPTPMSSTGSASSSIWYAYGSQPTSPEQVLNIKRLALRTLGTFDFTGHNLMAFLRSTVVMYLEHEDAFMRKEAALTCSKLLIPAHDKLMLGSAQGTDIEKGHGYRQGQGAARRVILPLEITSAFSDVLEKLIIVSIADPNKNIRLSVLSSLDPRFDRYLCQAENVRSLCKALNDEVFAIRVLAVKIAGRLTNLNPAYVTPPLRKCLIQLLTEIEFSGMPQNQENATKLLAQVIKHAPQLMRPYVSAILNALRPKLKDSSAGVASNVLAAVGELGEVGGESMRGYVEELLPLIIETLKDQSSAHKRENALRTLGKLASSTGYVMEPYLTHPILMSILHGFLKTEQKPAMRREVIKVIGIIGALDPYKYSMNESAIRGTAEVNMDHSHKVTQLDDRYTNMRPSHQDYYPTVAINALMGILNDPSLSVHHRGVIVAVLFIYKSLGMKGGTPFLSSIMGPFLNAIRKGEPMFRRFLFATLASLVDIVKEHIRSYLNDIFEVVIEFWNVDSIQITILPLVEAISVALKSEFKVYLSQLIPQILRLFQNDESEKRANTLKVLNTIEVFGTNLEDYLHLIIPPIMKLIESPEVPTLTVKARAIQTIGKLCRQLNFSDYASGVIHPLVRVLEDCAVKGSDEEKDLINHVMRTLCTLAYQLGADYAIFIPMVSKVLAKRHIQYAKYETLVSALLLNQPMPNAHAFWGNEDNRANRKSSGEPESSMAKNEIVNQKNLKNAWEASQITTKEDWNEWIRRLSVQLLRESPSPALRSCSSLAQAYNPLARELFNAAFVSCWSELYEKSQEELVENLYRAFEAKTVPSDITQTLLNLAECMEHDDKRLAADHTTLAEYAANCHAYAKALHYREMQFHQDSKNPEVIEKLIAILNQLKQPEAAAGILTYAKKNDTQMSIQEHWYEKLQQWDQALEAYEARQKGDLTDMSVTFGRMRCLNAIGRWAELHALAQEKWVEADDRTKKEIAPMAASAAWGLAQWDNMAEYISVMSDSNADGTFYHAVLAIHTNQFEKAQMYIGRSRELVDNDLTALVGESYNRAYRQVVRVQKLSELEEIIQYKRTDDSPEGLRKQALLRKMWTSRLKQCQRTVDVWQRILQVRLLVIPRQQDVDIWLKFSSLCRKMGLMDLSQKTLLQLMERPLDANLDTQLVMGLQLRLDTQQQAHAHTHGHTHAHVHAQGYSHSQAPTGLLTAEQAEGLSEHLASIALSLGQPAGTHTHAHPHAYGSVNGSVSMGGNAHMAMVMTGSDGANGGMNTGTNTGTGASVGVQPLFITHLSANARVTFAYLKHLWDQATRAFNVATETGDSSLAGGANNRTRSGPMVTREACVVMLCDFVANLPRQQEHTDANSNGNYGNNLGSNERNTMTKEERKKLLAKCHLKVGQWTHDINETLSDDTISNVLRSYRMATQYAPEWYTAWHTWALMNFEAVTHYESSNFKAGIPDMDYIDTDEASMEEDGSNDDLLSQQSVSESTTEGSESDAYRTHSTSSDYGAGDSPRLYATHDDTHTHTHTHTDAQEEREESVCPQTQTQTQAQAQQQQTAAIQPQQQHQHRQPTTLQQQQHTQQQQQHTQSQHTQPQQQQQAQAETKGTAGTRRAAHSLRQKDQMDEKERLRQYITYYSATAVSGFFRSISLLREGNSLQDTLRLLTLWFKYGSHEKVGVAMNEGTRSVPIDTWLQVIPQLIARIHTPSPPVRDLIHNLLTGIGKQHPQALIYPLTVASKSQSVLRKDAAEAITSKMRQNYPKLVEQTTLVSNELIRVAIVWHEMWHEGLEDASRLWFGEENFEGLYETLEPLHQMIKKGPETLREISFIQSYGHDLAQAHEWMQKYAISKDERAMSKAWELYYHVFKRIAKQLPQLTSLELQYVSPALLDAKDLDLAVPGTYKSGQDVVRIKGFAPTLSVITSKQRPRKLMVLGSDGQTYNYLLKGHEDLRQDERVMQLFALVNTLLVSDPETFKSRLNISRYHVIPLSPKSGLIGWVPHCDTLHALIKDYRESRKILLNLEHRIMLQMAPDYDHLTVPQKAEVFNHALETTTGQDLYKVLWLKSPNSEAWLERRTNYTRSLAVMSMVGYILGLGDRHPSNLMLDRVSGKIIHIDFGDCFEVAMHREKFPEKVPFRLTRMLVNAMEVSGIEGNYRMTCNNTLRVLRDNRDSLMAVLEAFVYDPLINWRLMETGGQGKKKKNKMAPADELIDHSDYGVTVYRVKNRDDPQDIADAQPEVVSERAVQVINRVQAKLTGRDFKATETLSVELQVERLLAQATSQENLCQLYVGWCPFW